MSAEGSKHTGAESPTTAKQLDFDDEHDTAAEMQQSGVLRPQAATVEDEESAIAPPKPSRSASPNAQAMHTLIEAFPTIDTKVIKAVLAASGGQVEPAFNALLGMSDPSFQEEAPPPMPPRRTPAETQMDADERLARQLAQEYQSQGNYYSGHNAQGMGAYGGHAVQTQGVYGGHGGTGRNARPRRSDEDGDRERNFFDDDLPEIKESVRQGFLQTQSTVNGWLKNFKKRLDGDENDPYNGPTPLPPRPNAGRSEWPASSPGRTRRSGDYDADPREIGDDFATLELRDDEAPPPKPARPTANPNLFKPTPAPPQSGPVDEVDAAERKTTSPGGASKKWQPLTAVAAQPEPDEDDPFSVGDSDDESSKKTDVRAADSARLKEAARNSISEGSNKPLEERKRGSVSTRDADAEKLLGK